MSQPTAREQILNLYNAEYMRGVNDGFAKAQEKARAVPPQLLARWRKLKDEFALSGDGETAGLIDAMIKDLLAAMQGADNG